MEICGLSDIGLVRDHNEDSFLISADKKYAMVADGMGGHLGGEVASAMCTSAMQEFLNSNHQAPSDTESLKNHLQSIVSQLNTAVYKRSASDPSLHGMGSTLTFFMERDSLIFWLNVGDSRIYRIRNQAIIQLTDDDSVVAELVRRGDISKQEQRYHPLKYIISKAIGISPELSLEVFSDSIQNDDLYVLCSDGLTDMLTDDTILQIAESRTPLHERCKAMITAANEQGGRDNITVILIQI